MSKQLFKNYTFEFDKNEKKILLNFCKQAQKQMEGDSKFLNELKSFNSLASKLSADGPIKLTKDEKTKLTIQLRENLKHINTHMKKGWFIKKWLYKSLYNQYNNLYTKYFED